jgi:alpha-ketoglutarate-dependent taurine dioxygenase
MSEIMHGQEQIITDLPFIPANSIYEGGRLADLDVQRAKRILGCSGHVLLRGFVHDALEFERLTCHFAKRFRVHGNPHRVWASADGRTQEVDSGTHALPAHSEMSYNPHYPDTLWFYCFKPNPSGGETTVCDGVAMLDAFDRDVREFFLSKRIEYRHCYEKVAWSRALRTASAMLARVKLHALALRFRHRGRVAFSFDDAESLHVRYVTSACTRESTGEWAFANSVEISTLPNGGGVLLEGGEPIPEHILDAVRKTSRRLSRRVPWRSGDVLMVDNRRVMHGRVAIPAGERKIFLRLGDLR